MALPVEPVEKRPVIRPIADAATTNVVFEKLYSVCGREERPEVPEHLLAVIVCEPKQPELRNENVHRNVQSFIFQPILGSALNPLIRIS